MHAECTLHYSRAKLRREERRSERERERERERRREEGREATKCDPNLSEDGGGNARARDISLQALPESSSLREEKKDKFSFIARLAMHHSFTRGPRSKSDEEGGSEAALEPLYCERAALAL